MAFPLRGADNNHLTAAGNRLYPAVTHYLPSMAEHLIVVADESGSVLPPEPTDSVRNSVLPDPETNSQKNIYVLHSTPTQPNTTTTTVTPTDNVGN
ncbi:unnamed protein product [Dibothriocephalus latus]|uniref:Uncharacterized protein n=1 Tax=Dibothriocephalus latus TaxID=60516 RepID=A0A3P7LLJ6_DIBLA|nr:unnamed protein product [Dibothriocephalus latus]